MNFLCKTESAADIPFVKTKVNYSEQTMDMGQYFEQNKLKLSKARLESRVQELIDNCVAAGAKNIVVRHVYAEDGICLFVYDDGSGMDGDDTSNNHTKKFHKMFKIKDVNKQKAGLGHFGEGFYVCAVSMLSNQFDEDRWEVYTKVRGTADLYGNICYAHLCNPRNDGSSSNSVAMEYDPDGCGLPAISQIRKIKDNELSYKRKFQIAIADCKNPIDMPLEQNQNANYFSTSKEYINSSGTLICLYTKQLWMQKIVDETTNEIVQEAQYGPTETYIDYMISDFSYTNRLPPSIKLHMKFGDRPITQIIGKKYLHDDQCELIARLHNATGQIYLDTLTYKGVQITINDGQSFKIKRGKYGANNVIHSRYKQYKIADLTFFGHMQFTVNNVLNEMYQRENQKKYTNELTNDITLLNNTSVDNNDNGTDSTSNTTTTTTTTRNNEMDDVAFKIRFSFKNTEDEGINEQLRKSKLYAKESGDSDRNKLTGWYFGMDIGNGRGERMVGELCKFKGEYYEQAHQWRHRTRKIKFFPRGEIIIGKKLVEFEWMAIQPVKSYSGGFGKESSAKTFKSFCGMFALYAQNYIYDELQETGETSMSSSSSRNGNSNKNTSRREGSKRVSIRKVIYEADWEPKRQGSKKGKGTKTTMKNLKAENLKYKKSVTTITNKLKQYKENTKKRMKKLVDENKKLKKKRKMAGKTNNKSTHDGNDGGSSNSGMSLDAFGSFASLIYSLREKIKTLLRNENKEEYLSAINVIFRVNKHDAKLDDTNITSLDFNLATLNCVQQLSKYVAEEVSKLEEQNHDDDDNDDDDDDDDDYNQYPTHHRLLQGVNIAKQKVLDSAVADSGLNSNNDSSNSSDDDTNNNNNNNNIEFHRMSDVDEDNVDNYNISSSVMNTNNTHFVSVRSDESSSNDTSSGSSNEGILV